jgi:hypothetical protein
VKRTVLHAVIVFFCIAAAAFACGRRTQSQPAGSVHTQTVAPAAAQPAPTGTDAMTQTVDVGDGRSEADGGVDTDPARTAAATGITPAGAAKAPAKKAKTKK